MFSYYLKLLKFESIFKNSSFVPIYKPGDPNKINVLFYFIKCNTIIQIVTLRVAINVESTKFDSISKFQPSFKLLVDTYFKLIFASSWDFSTFFQLNSLEVSQLTGNQWSISSTFCIQLIRTQIPKAQKDSWVFNLSYAFRIYECKSDA